MDSAEPATPRVSVVVPTRNRAWYLSRLLTALDRQEYANFDVVVVDDASDDTTARVLTSWQRPGRQVLRLGSRSGSYAARNRGWQAASGEIVAFTDDDCVPEPGWVAGLVRALNNPELLGAQGVTLAAPGRTTPFTHHIDQRRPGPPYRTCNVAYRRTVLEHFGGFDDTLRWYADNLFGLQARRVGPIGFAPDARVLHPPRPREWRDRNDWLARFSADVRHRQILRDLGVEPVTVPNSALPLMLWVLRPLLKQSAAHASYALRRPRTYLGQMQPMVHEKREMVAAMRMFWRNSRTGVPQSPLPLSTLPAHPLVSAVVVTRGRSHLLHDVLDSLGKQTWPHLEIVVGNHGQAEQVDTLARRYNARVVPVPAHATLAFARQATAEVAGGEVIAFIDDDCLADVRWAEALVEALQARPEWYGVQGRTEVESGPPDSHAVRVHKANALYQTCNIAYRREALERAGGFDLRFRGWFEDTALAARVLMMGPIGFTRRAVVAHRALSRRPLSRAEWRTLLADERLLANEYRDFYRRTRGPGFLPVVVLRWLIGSPLKTLARAAVQLPTHPRRYMNLILILGKERIALLRALFDV